MNDYKIGYLNVGDYKGFISYIKYINDKYNLQLNIIEVEDYTKDECDLVIYPQNSIIYDILLDRTVFKNAKGNPKFLMFITVEPHTCISSSYWNDHGSDDLTLYRTLTNYVPFCTQYKCYAISTYKDTSHNCCIPYCIDTWEVNKILYNNSIEKNKSLDKTKFCSMIFSHITKERETIYKLLSEYKRIDSYGNMLKNVEDRYYDDNELNILLPNYKFNICFENTHSDYNETYVTEKICRAFQWGTIPIYWGNNKQIYEIFNEKSFINLTDVPENKWVDIIKEYDTNDELYKQMLNEQPIINKDIHNQFFEKKEKFIIKILTKEY